MNDILDDLRKIEGFPKGEEKDLLALSLTPQYTAYPNPHIVEFINNNGKPYDETKDSYHKEPFVSDVSEGKGDPIYMAHTYHTKVPYKAIMPFINHYTQPGDIVFDGFCGTGMTGIAAQKLGRRAILCDLSPAATFIAYNFNNPPRNFSQFETKALQLIKRLQNELGWLYETNHRDGRNGIISYVIWSDVFLCPYCQKEIIFWEIAINSELQLLEQIKCTHCGAEVNKRSMSHVIERVFDTSIGKEIERSKQVPVLIRYTVAGKHFEKKPDSKDLELINKIEKMNIPYNHPTLEMPFGDKTGEPIRAGIKRVHQFYTKRNLWVLSALWNTIKGENGNGNLPLNHFLLFTITSFLVKTGSRLHNIGLKGGKINLAGQVPNTLFIPSLLAERNIFELFAGKVQDMRRAFGEENYSESKSSIITTQSTTNISQIPSNSIDYIFVDPPFGANLMYSELSIVWEAWLNVLTNNTKEAIINNSQRKELSDYRDLMTLAFSEMYRILKPKRWITVEFHNSKAGVWNAIQEAISHSGFLVAQVTVLNKQQGTFNQMTSPGAVENDLIINAYKPNASFTRNLLSVAGHGLESNFVREQRRQYFPIQ